MSQLQMTRGNSRSFNTTCTNLTGGSLTGYSAWFTAKRDASDADSAAVFQKTIAAGGIAVTSASILTTTVTQADTESLPTGYTVTLVYDVKVKDAAGLETTIDSGILTVLADVTQAI